MSVCGQDFPSARAAGSSSSVCCGTHSVLGEQAPVSGMAAAFRQEFADQHGLEAWFQGVPSNHELANASEAAAWSRAPAGWSRPRRLWEGLEVEDCHGLHGWHPVIRLSLPLPTSLDVGEIRIGLTTHLHNVGLECSLGDRTVSATAGTGCRSSGLACLPDPRTASPLRGTVGSVGGRVRCAATAATAGAAPRPGSRSTPARGTA